MFGVRPDRLDHEVEFVGAVDLARHAIGHAGPDELGFSEVIEPVTIAIFMAKTPSQRT
jgi:hypothetical protein